MTSPNFKSDFNDASKAAQILGRIGGKKTSEAKKRSSKANGLKGGYYKNFPSKTKQPKS